MTDADWAGDVELRYTTGGYIIMIGQGAQAVSKNNAVTTKLKHIQIQNLFVRECVSRGLVTVEYLETEDMPADIFTKPLTRVRVEHLRPCLGIAQLSQWLLWTIVHSS